MCVIIKNTLTNNYLILKSFKSYLFLSIIGLISATLGIVVDGLVIGNFLGNDGMVAYGLVSPVFILILAFATVFGNGGTILSSNYIGREEREKVNSSFTMACLIGLITSIVITAFSPFYVDYLSVLLGATGALTRMASDFMFGLILGTISLIFSQILFLYTRLDNNPNLGLISIIITTVFNITLDILFVTVLHLGIFGIGIATSISYGLGALVLCTHFFTKNNTLYFSKIHDFNQAIDIIKIGLPTALNRVFTMARTIVTNNVALWVGGVIVMGALTIQSSINQLLSAVAMGVGMTTMLLGGIFYGEEDRRSLADLLKISIKWGLYIIVPISVFVIVFAPFLVGLFGKNPEVLPTATVSLRLFALSLPPSLIGVVFLNFYSSINNTTMANYIGFAHSFLLISLFAVVLTPIIGDTGLWLCFFLGETFTLIGLIILIRTKTGRWPRKINDFLILDDSFEKNIKNSISISIGNDMDQVMELSNKIYSFIDKYPQYEDKLKKIALCVEEMAGNIVEHGFESSKQHYIDIRILLTEGGVIFRIRDDGKPFNPIEYGNDMSISKNKLGISIVRKIAKDISYRNTIGLNNLTIVL
ncbi:multidrug export protein MepA [Methanobrevibacter cuticularis]|uniref:Multidrug export protein MepA n=1 Tax=Methanobrevibacter cuticularis TaxID=47311 RepID=A0A166ENS1_9EURY|nr:MATE family efflux transporter [Methanobrevibacter cuticularis]KZX16852.1 multidrug export protein MepA [Methanobrevibacter cuticularis]